MSWTLLLSLHSEAATNGLVHAYRDRPQPHHIEVTGVLISDELAVTVGDTGFGLLPNRDSPGLGLALTIIAQTAASENFSDPNRRCRGAHAFAFRTALP